MEKRIDDDMNSENITIETDGNEIDGGGLADAENAAANDGANQQNTENDPEASQPEDDENGSEDSLSADDGTLEKWKNQARASEDKYLRLLAEFANYKKRVEREREETADYFRGDIIKKMLPVLDDFSLMLKKTADEENEVSLFDGAKLIFEKFTQILEKEGLTQIDAMGQAFDPEVHEALMMQPIADETNNNKVVDVFQEGYILRDKLLRPTKVVVGTFDDA